MHEIIPNLYLASYGEMRNLGLAMEDMYIVNCTKDLPMLGEGTRIEVDDNGASESMTRMFLRLLDVPQRIHEELESGRDVVVHCMAGQQRSPTVIAAYLMKFCGMSLENAIRHVRTKKPDAFFWSINFLESLQRFEMLLLS